MAPSSQNRRPCSSRAFSSAGASAVASNVSVGSPSICHAEPGEDGQPGLRLDLLLAPGNELALQRGKETDLLFGMRYSRRLTRVKLDLAEKQSDKLSEIYFKSVA